jgi:hypothetical protein
VIGIDVHIGSQLTDLEPFEMAYTKVADLTGRCARTATISAARSRRRARHSLRAVELRAAAADWNTAM